MSTATEEIRTVKEFIERILLDSKIPEAAELVAMAEKALPRGLWSSFCFFAPTVSTIGNLIDCIARQVASRLAKLEDEPRIGLRKAMLDFFEEIRIKAEEIEEAVDVAGIIGVYKL